MFGITQLKILDLPHLPVSKWKCIESNCELREAIATLITIYQTFGVCPVDVSISAFHLILQTALLNRCGYPRLY